MKKIKGKICRLTEKFIEIEILNVEGQPVSNIQKLRLTYDENKYNDIVGLFKYPFINCSIDNGILLDITESETPDNMQLADSNFVIQEIIKKHEGELNKSALYEEYQTTVSCCLKTAKNHTKEAITKGFIKEKDYHTLSLIDNEDKEEEEVTDTQ